MFRSKRSKVILIFTLIATFSLIGIFKPVKGAIRTLTQPIIKPLSSSTLKVKDFFYSITSLKDKLSLVENFEAELHILRAENARLQLAGEENKILREQLGLKKDTNFTLVSSQVISRDPVGARNLVTIDRGEDFGVSAGNAILDEFGNLLGIVVEVYKNNSDVLVITDGNVRIDALVLGSNALGVVEGSHGLGLDLDLISQEVKINKGDQIVTSGLTGELPSGILIGIIDDIQSDESDLFQKLSVLPSAKTRDFRFVLVVTDF